MINNKRAMGNIGENAASEHLIKNGFIILERNFRYKRLGEIDIIARENNYLCFIEVKCRRNNTYGSPSEAVTRRKQEKILKLAYIYMNIHNLKEEYVRFDVAEVIMFSNDGKDKFNINYIRDAFRVS